ncbi:hypothetical protein ABB37_08243 [Leptomonas pyrrhocoris]|uniref:SMP-LTD domain-containing protein n=1 Tax=Leptomonas pyrrhocoris TaxID=157538 RepID=A0A0M9FTG5_LEPPY|nr:hypothetical protein ABB37_08243 [Leptomonas pyrrhocoris]KPA75683.1 hypothetical protein ABB37_08243 [Leptomonas pyrrhocoris]|eukprot:XP_015654122.1 hypothetical protein ABB37_08243 [Leptomonas pyrrhocoris]
MAEVSAFVYGWMAGIFAVIIWILYGIDTLLHVMRFVNATFAHLPGLSHLASDRKDKHSPKKGRSASTGESGTDDISAMNTLSAEEGLEGLTGSTKRVTPITANGLCMLSWYGPDGSTGAPIECRLSLENNEVTIYQLLRVADTNPGATGGAAGKSSDGGRGPGGQAGQRGGTKEYDTSALRSAAGVAVAEHRKGRVSVLHTTVMELKHFNKSKKNAGEKNGNGGAAAKSTASRNGGANGHGSETGSVGPSQKKSKQAGNADADEEVSDRNTAQGSKSKRRESAASNSYNTSDPLADCTLRPGVDPLFTGRVLIWRTMDGQPLFDSIHASQPTPGSKSFGGSMNGSARDGSFSSLAMSQNTKGGSAHSYSHSPSAESLADERSVNSSVADGDDSEGDDDAHSDQNGRSSEGSVEEKRRNPGGDRRRIGRRSGKKNSAMGDMANWSCVIIKFERARESERWHTLLSGLREARAWHDFAKMLPNPDTINIFLSRFFFQNMRLNGLRDAIITQIRKKLRQLPAKKFPRNLGGQLVLDEFLIGTQIPWISDVSEPTVSANGEVGFDFNLLYKGGEGGFSLFFRLALEFLGIRVPHVVFSVKLIELEATVHISIGPPPSNKFWIGGHKPPVLRLEVHQGCASGKGILHRVLTSLPDLSGVMTNLVKLYLFSDMVLPYMDDFPLPSVVKSPKVSQRDLRVRTFDRQRAAKISSAPVQSKTAAAATTTSPPTGSTPGSSPSKSKAESSTSVKAPALKPGEQSGTTKPAPAETSPAPSEREEKAKTMTPSSQLTTPQEAANTGGSNRAALDSSINAGRVRHVASPIQLASSTNANWTSSNSGQLADRKSNSGDAANTSVLSEPHHGNETTSITSSMNRGLLSESELTETEGTFSAVPRKRRERLSTMRHLRSLLKVKGKDMTRESVSRSKDKPKR